MKLTINQRKHERVAAILFIIATLSYGIGSVGLEALVVKEASFSLILPYALLEIMNSLAVIGIGVCFYLIFKEKHLKAARLYLLSRIGEGILLTIGTVLAVGVSGSKQALMLHDTFFALAMILLGVFSAGFFYYLMKRAIGPKWLNVVGLFGYQLLSVYALIYFIPNTEASLVLFGPGAVFEIALPIYLLIRGYGIINFQRKVTL